MVGSIKPKAKQVIMVEAGNLSGAVWKLMKEWDPPFGDYHLWFHAWLCRRLQIMCLLKKNISVLGSILGAILNTIPLRIRPKTL